MTLRRYVAENEIVPFNDKLKEGIGGTMLKELVSYLDMLFTNSANQEGFPKGVTYEGIEMATPEEAYGQFCVTKHSRSRTVVSDDKIKSITRGYEISAYDFYAIKINLALYGEMLEPRISFLPYTSFGGIMRMRGSTYSVSPILADIAMSVKNDSVYVPFISGKINFWRFTQNFLCNGERQSVSVVYTKAWHKIIYPNHGRTSCAHYLFASHGFKNTMARFGKCEANVGYVDTINTTTHPVDIWDIFSSTGIRPSAKRNESYEPSYILVAVRKEDRSLIVDQIVGAFFYCVDRYPDRIHPEYIDSPYIWKLLMGKIMHDHTGEGKLVGAVESHLNGVFNYICPETKANYADDNVFIDNWDDLIVYLMVNYHSLVSRGGESSMYGKRLKLNRYIGDPIIHKFNKLVFALKKEASTKPLTKAVVSKLFNTYLSAKTMFSINNKHGEVNSYSTSSDNCIFMRMQVILQDNATKGVHRKLNLNDPKQLIDVSLADAGRYNAAKKNDPTGRGLNPCVTISDEWDIVQRPELADMLNRTDELLKM